MSSPEEMRSTAGMVDYAKNSTMQQRLVRYHGRRIGELVARLGEVTPELRLLDLGCGPGPSAIDAVSPAIAAYRVGFPEAPIAVCHADQPGNDWNSLFALATGPDGYLRGAEGVRMEAAVGSFYEPMAAAGSVALATSFAASHWLSQAVQLQAPGRLWFADLEGDARAELAALARRDWARFLECRALELRPGGYLLMSTLGAVPEAGEINGVAASGRGIYRALQLIAQGMVDDGLLDQAALDSFVFGIWFMTEAEARAPLEEDSGLAAAFEIEDILVEPAAISPADVYADELQDPAAYARLYSGYTRGFSESALRQQLFDPADPKGPTADRLAQEFYRRLEALYRAETARHAGEVWHLTVLLRRR